MTKTTSKVTRETFTGTKRELEVMRRNARASLSKMPRWHSLSMDVIVHVDRSGTVYVKDNAGVWTRIVAQCIPQ